MNPRIGKSIATIYPLLHYGQVSMLYWYKVEEPSYIFDGTRDVEEFLEEMSLMIPKVQLVMALDATLRSTASKWWAMHKDILKFLKEIYPALQHWFNPLPKYPIIYIPRAAKDPIAFIKVYQEDTNPVLHTASLNSIGFIS